MTAQEYNRFAVRLRAYRRAFDRFLYDSQPEKAAAILPRLKMAEAEESEMFERMKNCVRYGNKLS